ncbi:MAG: hypothetical protein ACLTKG_06345 [Collinsella intestinalis]
MVGRTLPLTHELFDFAETIFDVLNSRTVDLVKKGEEKGLRVSFPDFPYLIIWSKPEGDFVAIEPWGGLSTCSDEGDIFEDKRSCLTAKPARQSPHLRSRFSSAWCCPAQRWVVAPELTVLYRPGHRVRE